MKVRIRKVQSLDDGSVKIDLRVEGDVPAGIMGWRREVATLMLGDGEPAETPVEEGWIEEEVKQ